MPVQYDIAVIGAGSAGLTAARFAARLGKRVALIEANRVGGDCTWTGCVPSKALLHAAKAAHIVRNANRYGITAKDHQVDFSAVMGWVKRAVKEVYAQESPDALRSEGIEVLKGRAEFRDAHTLTVGECEVSARRFLICTGAAPFTPPIPGLEDTPRLTYETFWNLDALPERLVIIGGGPIGCELAQACQRLGSRVTLVEAADRVLPNDEPEASQVVARALRQDGICLRLSAPVESVGRRGDGPCVLVSAGGGTIKGDALLVAAGRRARVDGLGLEKAGIEHSPRGITVDDFLRTSVKHIYAAGDCAGGYQFTHYAGFQGAMAVRNMLLPGRSRGRPQHPPWATFTDPEVAHSGYTEEQGRQRFGDKVRVSMLPMAQVDRAVSEDATEGFIKVVRRNNGETLGATVVGQRAAETLQAWTLAGDNGLKMADVARTMQAYPSLATGNQQVAWDTYLDALTTGPTGKLVRWFAGSGKK